MNRQRILALAQRAAREARDLSLAFVALAFFVVTLPGSGAVRSFEPAVFWRARSGCGFHG